MREKEGRDEKKWGGDGEEETATEREKTSAILREREGFLISGFVVWMEIAGLVVAFLLLLLTTSRESGSVWGSFTFVRHSFSDAASHVN